MPVSLFQRAAAGALAASLLWPQLAAAIDRAATDAIVRLLEVGWSNSPQARAAADLQVAEVAKLAAGESVAQQAWLLVLLQQRRYDEALKRADALIAKDPADTTALRAKIWVATLLKNYEASMLAAEELSKRLAADPPMNEADQAVHDDLYKFLGRIYGFLGGPIAADVNQGDRKAAEKLIVDRIPETRRALFEEARDSVIAKFLEATGAQDDERLKAIAAADAAKDKTLKEIEEERETITDRAKDLEDRRSQLQGEIRDELAEIAKEDRPLVQDLARLEARAGSLNRDLLSYDVEIGRLQAQADREENENVRRQLLREADRLAFIASRLQTDLIALNRQADAINSQRAGLLARQQRAQKSVADQVRRIDEELTALVKRDKRNDAIEKRAARPATGVTSKGRALAAQATALTTYDPFPLEAAKAKLLESLR
jgi:DNA repair exonuclease SbcCD ATPase subunit